VGEDLELAESLRPQPRAQPGLGEVILASSLTFASKLCSVDTPTLLCLPLRLFPQLTLNDGHISSL
jgi:hypothetical protein